MPELPEVETMVRGIRPHVEGRTLVGLRACPCRCRPVKMTPTLREMSQRLRGRVILRVRRLAKRIVLEFDSGDALVIEPRMTGLMLVSDPPDAGHLRIEFRLDGGPGLWFWDRRGLGTVTLYSKEGLVELEDGGRLGPDPLEMTAEDWWLRLQRTARPVKVALLDQSLAAGIGNLYASEILHRSRIHPAQPACSLSRVQVERLACATQAILLEAIEHEGSTLSDGTYRNALNKAGGYQNSHRVYDKADRECPTCLKGSIQRIVQAQRSTFFCPRCQVVPRRVKATVRRGSA